MTRRVTIQTPVGDQLQFRQLKGEEAISQLFRFDIDLLSDSKGIDPKALLGKNATVVVETQGVGCDISMESSRDLVCRVRIIGITPTGSN